MSENLSSPYNTDPAVQAAAAREQLNNIPWAEISQPVKTPQELSGIIEEQKLDYGLRSHPDAARSVLECGQRGLDKLQQTPRGKRLPENLELRVVTQVSPAMYKQCKDLGMLDMLLDSYPSMNQAPSVIEMVELLEESRLPGGTVSRENHESRFTHPTLSSEIDPDNPDPQAEPLADGTIGWMAVDYRTTTQGTGTMADQDQQILFLIAEAQH